MNPEAQQELDRILHIDPSALLEKEKDFLRARRGYLGPADKAAYASVLQEELEKEELALEDMTYQELKDKATELAIDFPGTIKKTDLIALIKDVQEQNA